MKVLLDTHAFLWWVSDGGSRLSDRARELIASPNTEPLFSVASAFEIATKAALGRLTLPFAPERYVPERVRRHGFTILPIELPHALRAGGLPMIHRDPWDRILVAQAQVERLAILSADPAIGRYDVETIW